MTGRGTARLLPLDFLRGVAALIVVVVHFSGYAGFYADPTIAKACVWFFFVLSGYILTYVYQEAISSRRIGAGAFMWRRFARLYPLHIITTAFMFIGLSLVAGGIQWGVRDIIESATMMHFLLGGMVAVNAPSWSLGVEIWGSLLVFMLCALGKVWRVVMIAAVVAFLFFSSGLIRDTYGIGFLCFVAGYAAFQIERGRYFARAPLPEIIMRLSGQWSYGIYLWHVPVAFLFVGAVRLAEINSGSQLLGSPLLMLVYIPAVIVVAAVSFHCWENPARKLLRGLLPSDAARSVEDINVLPARIDIGGGAGR